MYSFLLVIWVVTPYHCFLAGVEKQCKHCQQVLFGSYAIKQHNTKYSRFKCPRCMVRICDRKQLYKHILTHRSYKRQCPKCLKQFTRSDLFKEHRKSIHVVDSLTSQENKKRREWLCTDCNKKFRTFLVVRKHFNVFCQERCKSRQLVCCEMCRKMFSNEQNLFKHFKLHKSYDQSYSSRCKKTKSFSSTVKRSKRLFRRVILKTQYCTECLRGFTDCESFYSHVNKNTCPYFKEDGMCMLCKKVFHSLETLKTHVKTCFKETISDLVNPLAKKTQPSASASGDVGDGGAGKGTRAVYHCTRCRTMFPSKLIYSKHIMLFHGKTKTLQCNKCFFSCRSTRLLKKHLKKKLCPSIKTYKCYLCDNLPVVTKDLSVFNSLESLLKHLRSHKHLLKRKESTRVVIKPQEIKTANSEKGVLLTLSKTDAMNLVGKSCECNIEKYGNYIISVKPIDGGYQVVAVPKNPVMSCYCCKFKHPINSFLHHFSSHHRFRAVQLVVCYHCNIVFKDKPTWDSHMLMKHQMALPMESVETVEKSLVSCVEHKESIATPSPSLPDTQYPSSVYVCRDCHLVYDSLQSLTRHLNLAHEEDTDIAFKNKKGSITCVIQPEWSCCFCAKNGIRDVFRHAASHLTTNSIVLECYRCNVKVTTKAQLNNHLNSKHQGEWSTDDSRWVDEVWESCTFKLVQLMYKRQDMRKFGAEVSKPGKDSLVLKVFFN